MAIIIMVEVVAKCAGVVLIRVNYSAATPAVKDFYFAQRLG